MLDTPRLKKLYKEIQTSIYYMIPEKWSSVYLYASITEKVYKIPIGEMFFYYFPKGILKKRPVNVYEIPSKFNIDEDIYMKLVKDLYNSIQKLREEYIKNNQKIWTSLTISIENNNFTIEYNYDSIDDWNYSNDDRKVIWKYKYLGIDTAALNRKERAVIQRYLSDNKLNNNNEEKYIETMYKKPIHKNIVDYDKPDNPLEQNVIKKLEERKRKVNNQILASIDSGD